MLSCYTTANLSMVDLDHVEDSPNDIVGLPMLLLTQLRIRKKEHDQKQVLRLGDRHDTAQTRPIRIRSVSDVLTEGCIHSS